MCLRMLDNNLNGQQESLYAVDESYWSMFLINMLNVQGPRYLV